MCADIVIKTSLLRQSMDNVTCIFIAFQNFANTLFNNNNPNFSHFGKIRQKTSFLSENDILLKDNNYNYNHSKNHNNNNNKLKKNPSYDLNDKKIEITESLLLKLNNTGNKREIRLTEESDCDCSLPKIKSKKDESSINIPDLNDQNEVSNIDNNNSTRKVNNNQNNTKREFSIPNNKLNIIKKKYNFN